MDGDIGFLGTGWAFPPAFDRRSCSAVTASGVEDVEESLHILLGTTPGERLMHPSYGCNLRRMVFQTINTSALTEIRSLIEKAVLLFEPRIALDAVTFDTTTLPDGLLRIRLDYRLRASNSPHNLVYPLYLREGHAAGGRAP
ncbi:GPW/gp25 family protein [Roseateles cellulosilyticus]|uniref:GPW/gp25 family protein n=1 Tax=Pelomonas cellulosilytica TaxID=2906762 RepID=A0ABS8XNI8_9BURK|nr:GPW/gp25 family protein [Pelomonas sp. P8]MCE4554327.1 GPW/gp25 family protein [Pelomonas sp. P8]